MSLSLPFNPTTDRGLKYFSDEAIARHMYTKYHDSHKIRINVDDYIAFVDNIITTVYQITIAISQGTKGRLIFSNDFLNINVVDPPVCTLHQISSELACKGPGREEAHQTTLDILDLVINYPWEAKAVLTLTAFATEYGEIWHLNHYSALDPLANSLAMIKRVPFLKNQLNSIKYWQLLLDPSSLIYCCLRAIEYMNQLNKLAKFDVKEQRFSGLSSILRQIPLVSYWVIHIVVAAGVEISSYLNETEGQPQKYLNELYEKISSILNMLETHLNIIRQQQDF